MITKNGTYTLLLLGWLRSSKEKDSTDPMWHKYPHLTPYNYCANNPVMLVEPDGRKIVISGILSRVALAQLQAIVGDSINLNMDSEGNVTYSLNNDKRLKGNAKLIAKVIDDNSISVNLMTTNGHQTSSGNYFTGGAFLENNVSHDENMNIQVEAYQLVNPNVLGLADERTNTMGKMMLHEITKAYEGAKISQKEDVGVGPATASELADPNSVYNRSHRKATAQTSVFRQFYDSKCQKTDDINKATKVEWYMIKNGKQQVIRTLE